VNEFVQLTKRCFLIFFHSSCVYCSKQVWIINQNIFPFFEVRCFQRLKASHFWKGCLYWIQISNSNTSFLDTACLGVLVCDLSEVNLSWHHVWVCLCWNLLFSLLLDLGLWGCITHDLGVLVGVRWTEYFLTWLWASFPCILGHSALGIVLFMFLGDIFDFRISPKWSDRL
jgi:hypothetical protein